MESPLSSLGGLGVLVSGKEDSLALKVLKWIAVLPSTGGGEILPGFGERKVPSPHLKNFALGSE